MALDKLLCQHFNSINLRFPERKEEAAFQADFGKNLARNGVFFILAVFAASISTIPMLLAERKHSTNPFEWGSGDPRTWFFCIRFVSILFGTLYSFCSFLRWRYGMLRSLNWENLTLGMGCWWMSPLSLSNWHIAKLGGAEPQEVWGIPTEGGYFVQVLVIDAVITIWCLFVPVRCCKLWLLSAWGCCSFNLVSAITGSPFPEAHRSIVITLAILLFIAPIGASRNEKHARKEWRASRQVVESQEVVNAQQKRICDRDAVVSSMAAVIQALCDIVVELKPDLCVCNANRSHTSFFGIDFSTKPFTEVVSPGDLQRFKELLLRVDKDAVPQCLPVTLLTHSKPVEANFLAMSTGVSEPSYIIGVRCDQQTDPYGVSAGVVEASPLTESLENAMPSDDTFAFPPGESVLGEKTDPYIVAMMKEENHEMESVASMATFKTTPSGPLNHLGLSPWMSISVVGLGMGNYTQIRLAGKGSQATVFEVKDERGQTFALKRISLLGKVWQRDFGSNLRAADREVRLLKSLSWASEVVVHLKECWIQSDMRTACIVMEWLPKTLSGVLHERTEARKGLVPLKDVCRWLARMTFGIAAIHSVGWMHRDVKTGNMLLSEDERQCKVADLGIGRPMRETLQKDVNLETGSVCETASLLTGYTEKKGTISYMSPEALAPGGLYGQSVDIYGLGCVLLELLVGSTNFSEAATKGMSEDVAAATLEATEQLPCADDDDRKALANVKKLCLQMLSESTEDRPTAGTVLGSEVLKVYVEELIEIAPSLNKENLKKCCSNILEL